MLELLAKRETAEWADFLGCLVLPEETACLERKEIVETSAYLVQEVPSVRSECLEILELEALDQRATLVMLDCQALQECLDLLHRHNPKEA